ncbi:MAG: triose-phosphate isomerase [Actinomycetota bacterium]|nr:triose-phosphate isomerase [Actinomycetota bacterium]
MSQARRPLMAGNWKMNKTVGEAEDYVRTFLDRVSSADRLDVGLCAPFTALPALVEAARGSGVAIYAQTMYHEDSGAYTGEISPAMLVDLGVDGVVLGHSERRELFCETDETLRLKVPAALRAGLHPILCVGETEDERESDETERKLRHQVGEDLAEVSDDRLAEVAIAYEPIWAIGSGNTATPDQAQEAIAYIRECIGERSGEQAQRIRIVYGGSVKPDNADELLALPDIDGGLVGGASLDAEDFAKLVDAVPR